MQAIDLEILYYLNLYSQRSVAFDHLVKELSQNNLLKGSIFVSVFWYMWFRFDSSARPAVIVAIIGSLITMVITRLLALSLPFKLRPRHDPTVDFIMPHGSRISEVQGNSSFPSDHAALFFAFSTGLYLTNKKAGIVAFIYSILFICLPRLYLGLHYFSDILSGALIGSFVIIATMLITRKVPITETILRYEQKYKAVFYAFFFILSIQLATMFEDSRALARIVSQALR